MNVRPDPFVGAVSKGKATRYVRTRSQDGRERWVVLTPDRQFSGSMESQFSHYGVPVGQKSRIEWKYDALRVGLIRLSLVW